MQKRKTKCWGQGGLGERARLFVEKHVDNQDIGGSDSLEGKGKGGVEFVPAKGKDKRKWRRGGGKSATNNRKRGKNVLGQKARWGWKIFGTTDSFLGETDQGEKRGW